MRAHAPGGRSSPGRPRAGSRSPARRRRSSGRRVDRAAGRLDLGEVPRLHGCNPIALEPAAKRRARPYTRDRACRSSTSSRSGRSRRTATSSAPIEPRPRRSSSTRAARRPRSASGSPRSARAAPRSSSRTATSITCSASPTWPRAPGARSTRPRRARRCSRARTRSRRRADGPRRGRPTCSSRAASRSSSPACTFDVVSVPGTRRGTSRTRSTARCSPGTSSSRARSVARTSPAPTGRRCSPRSASLVDRLPAGDRRCTRGTGPSTTLGAELARNPFLAELRRESVRRPDDRPAADRAAARHP